MKTILLTFVLSFFIVGCTTIQDERPPLMNDDEFANYAPLPETLGGPVK